MAEHAGAEVNELDSGFGFVLEEHVFGFEVRMDDEVVSEEY